MGENVESFRTGLQKCFNFTSNYILYIIIIYIQILLEIYKQTYFNMWWPTFYLFLINFESFEVFSFQSKTYIINWTHKSLWKNIKKCEIKKNYFLDITCTQSWYNAPIIYFEYAVLRADMMQPVLYFEYVILRADMIQPLLYFENIVLRADMIQPVLYFEYAVLRADMIQSVLYFEYSVLRELIQTVHRYFILNMLYSELTRCTRFSTRGETMEMATTRDLSGNFSSTCTFYSCEEYWHSQMDPWRYLLISYQTRIGSLRRGYCRRASKYDL